MNLDAINAQIEELAGKVAVDALQAVDRPEFRLDALKALTNFLTAATKLSGKVPPDDAGDNVTPIGVMRERIRSASGEK